MAALSLLLPAPIFPFNSRGGRHHSNEETGSTALEKAPLAVTSLGQEQCHAPNALLCWDPCRSKVLPAFTADRHRMQSGPQALAFDPHGVSPGPPCYAHLQVKALGSEGSVGPYVALQPASQQRWTSHVGPSIPWGEISLRCTPLQPVQCKLQQEETLSNS